MNHCNDSQIELSSNLRESLMRPKVVQEIIENIQVKRNTRPWRFNGLGLTSNSLIQGSW